MFSSSFFSAELTVQQQQVNLPLPASLVLSGCVRDKAAASEGGTSPLDPESSEKGMSDSTLWVPRIFFLHNYRELTGEPCNFAAASVRACGFLLLLPLPM